MAERSPSRPPSVRSGPASAASRRAPELDTLASRWQRALDAAQRALAAAGEALPTAYLGPKRRDLAQEREQTGRLLVDVAELAGVRPVPWLSPVPVTNRMLGLPAAARACLLDLDGVLTDSGLLQAWAWGEVLDEFLLHHSLRAGWHFIRFDPDSDYRTYIDGRPRLEGIRAFLGSRGIVLPEGRHDDPATVETVYSLANRKRDLLAHGLHERGVTALPEARRFLEAAGHAGLGRVALSASTSTEAMLEVAGLASLVEGCVGAGEIREQGLRSRPAPDLLLAACRSVGVAPEAAVTLTRTPAGVAAGHAAGVAVIGVGEGAAGDLLRGFGAEQVVPSLGALLDPLLLSARR